MTFSTTPVRSSIKQGYFLFGEQEVAGPWSGRGLSLQTSDALCGGEVCEGVTGFRLASLVAEAGSVMEV